MSALRGPLRVVVTGSEYTGKTTLAQALGARFGAPVSIEASRSYAESVARLKGRDLAAGDLEPIAVAQIEAEDQARARAKRLVILDTDLLSTVVYANHYPYYGGCPAWIEAAARDRRGDLYLFCQPDLPWIGDGVRDRATQREEVNELFSQWLTAIDARVAIIVGLGEERTALAEAAVTRLLAEAR